MNLKQKLFWKMLTGISVVIILYMAYSTYTLNDQLSTFETTLAKEEAKLDDAFSEWEALEAIQNETN